MGDLSFTPAEELVDLIRRKQLSPLEVTDHALARIERLNSKLNAFVALDAERARDQAMQQTERSARGEDLGPLGGVPIGVKDLEHVRGFPTTFGSRPFREHRPNEDDVHIARLRRAGAIIVGKTNTPSFGAGVYTDNELFGPTRNPWNMERTSGGSSGGSATAIASGMVPLATSSDGGGSIRIPAAYTGLYGLKVTYGRVPVAPRDITHWVHNTVYGVLARTVRDAALYLDQIAGYHPADPFSLPKPDYSYLQRLEEPLPRLRIAFNRTLGVTRLQPEVEREVEAAATTFRDLGHEVVDHEEAIPEIAVARFRIMMFYRLSVVWDTYVEQHDQFGVDFIQKLDAVRDVSAEDFSRYFRLRARLIKWVWRLFEDFDLLLTPTLPTEAFAAEGPVPLQLAGSPFNPIAFTYPFNDTGNPAASVRAGFTDSGLPCGLQIVGPRHRDDLVLQASYAYEQARPWNDRWPRL